MRLRTVAIASASASAYVRSFTELASEYVAEISDSQYFHADRRPFGVLKPHSQLPAALQENVLLVVYELGCSGHEELFRWKKPSAKRQSLIFGCGSTVVSSWRFGRGVTSNAVLLVVRERDNAFGLGAMAGEIPADRGPAITAAIPWMCSFTPSVLRRLAEYEDVSDADRLVHDSAMHCVLAAWWLRSFASDGADGRPIWRISD